MFRAPLVFSLLLGTAAAAENWPRFRGPNACGTGQGATLPKSWDAAAAKWSAELAGEGDSSPVVWGGRVFVSSAVDRGAGRVLQCFDLANGKQHWSRETESAPHKRHKNNSFASSTPAVDAEHVYVVWGQPKSILIVAYTHAGEEAWRKDLGAYKSGHGYGVSPIVAGGKLIVPNDQEAGNSVIALDARSGKEAWRTPRTALRATYSTPVLYPHDNAGTDIIVTDWQQGVSAIDLASGKQRWSSMVFDIDDKQRAIGSPVLWDDLIIATCGFVTGKKRLVALRPPPGGQGEPEKVFQLDRGVPHVPTPLAHDGRLYLWADDGMVSCAKLPGGELLYDRERVPARAKFYSSPIAVGDKIVNFSDRGEVVVLQAGDAFKVVAEGELPETTHATAAVAGGKLLVRTRSKLMAF